MIGFCDLMDTYAVLIPTRNRPDKIVNLLKSLSKSSIKPSQVVVVASGTDISEVLSAFKNSLPITYLYTQVTGQIAQKKLGVGLVSNNIDWCLFLDDDLEISTNAVENALREEDLYNQDCVVGIGFSLPPTTRSISVNSLVRSVAKLFRIDLSKPGRVERNGHANSYLQEQKVTETQWLNGASMWRTPFIYSYGEGIPSTRYAACEDLIFSYPIGKLGKLLYVPTAKLSFQDRELSDFDGIDVMRAAAYWRFYFVSGYPEFSKWNFLFTQIGRTAFATFSSKKININKLTALLQIVIEITFAILKRDDPKKLLIKLVM
jgi:glycosyltransferase involved in cell wall biosynthesis